MITHNGKQVTLAMRNRKAINLIARNGKAIWDIGGGTGIRGAAAAVILAEYGKQVWSDVKQYAKAHPQIVEFINQDPHLACSISPNSNKERWLVTDGFACIQTKTILNGYSNITSICMVPKNLAGNQTLWCARETTNSNTYTAFLLGASIRSDYGSGQTATGRDMPREQSTELRTYESDFYLNGERLVDRSVLSFSTTNGVSLFASYSTAGAAPYTNVQSGFKQGIFKVEQGEDLVLHLIPYQRPDGQCGMLDLVTYTFHPNANTTGQFTIAITDKE